MAAGAIIASLLEQMGLNVTHVHIDNAHLALVDDFTHYITTTREPISRTISAFNYRHAIGGTDVFASSNFTIRPSPREMQLYMDCFPELPGGVSRFAEALSEDGECADLARACVLDVTMHCEHMSKGHAYFLSQPLAPGANLLGILRRPDKHSFVVRQEKIDADMDLLMDWLCIPVPDRSAELGIVHVGYPRESDTAVSDAGRTNLERLMAAEVYARDVVHALSDNMRPPQEWGQPTALPPGLAPYVAEADVLCGRARCVVEPWTARVDKRAAPHARSEAATRTLEIC